MDVDGLPFNNRPSRQPSTVYNRFFAYQRCWIGISRHSSHHITVDALDESARSITQVGRAFCDRVQHGLNIGRRAGDDTEDFARGSLLFQRFLQFGEQPDVFDGDDCLIGEGFEKSDLLVGKWADFGSANQNSSDCDVFAKQWCSQESMNTEWFRESIAF